MIDKTQTIIVTGGAGFIGANLVRLLVSENNARIVNLDKLTYAGHLESLHDLTSSDRYAFEQVDITDAQAVARVFSQYKPSAVVHLAAESHVDRSIDGPRAFIDTNILGTYVLLEQARLYWKHSQADEQARFRFLHVSTDEVYGDIGSGAPVTETASYAPNSPYSASKAASDHLARAWHTTYGLPVITSNCSNNYGPYQFPEKLVPLTILNALDGRKLPVYGDGSNVRDWLYVEDHVRALALVLRNGTPGETYNIGGSSEKTNIQVVHTICDLLQEEIKTKVTSPGSFRTLINFVADRPGHDRRYAVDASKLTKELGWAPQETFESGMRKTVRWYMDQRKGWCKAVQGARFDRERLGLDTASSMHN